MKFFAPLLVALALLSSDAVAKSNSGEETKTIEQLYADAVSEGGNLVLYHGGDTATSQDTLHDAFVKRFPKMNFTTVVDYSKYHDVRIDNQLETDTLIPDVVALQTLQDFTRWAKTGDLLPYKPANFSKIHSSLRDRNGAWLAYAIYQFSFIYNTTALNGLEPPVTPADLVDPKYAGMIASSYPNDDDAVLFLYSRYVDKYGWDWVSQLAKRNVSFTRGTNVARELVTSGEKAIGVGSSVRGDALTFVTNGTEYLGWGQRMGILSKAKHPAAAKLFMNWIISEEAQLALVANSPRTDINTNEPWDIPEANMAAFSQFMEDRTAAEEWRQTFSLYFGEVQGKPSPGWLGLHPGNQ